MSEAVRGADALFLWDFFSEAVQDAWPQADRLSWIHVAAAGVDKLIFDELAASEVTVTNAQGTFDRPIAEWVLGAVLAEAKDFAAATSTSRRRSGSTVRRVGCRGSQRSWSAPARSDARRLVC
ncbi:hypothetical protein [Nesterenkonia pannonica]|uniref:hypothetical protein n=1 Tax=Nesterenkonia pannonica TaxID=1548602 RepID=UPI002164C301|nr:hypothetical protein [Nesterenkonia pannonica]